MRRRVNFTKGNAQKVRFAVRSKQSRQTVNNLRRTCDERHTIWLGFCGR